MDLDTNLKIKNPKNLQELNINWSNYSLLFNFCFICVLFLIIFFSYIQAEILSFLYKKEFETETINFCQKKSPELKYIKILQIEKSKKKATTTCIFENKDENLKVFFGYSSGRWSINHSQKLNEKKSFYWPIYL
jgi:hypothetical protein